MSEPLLRISDLKTHFQIKGAGLFGEKKVIKAVDGGSFDIAPGEVLSLVGESGCGKSTVGRTLTHLEKATSGTAQFEGQDFLAMAPAEFRPLRREIQMIFQDPMTSLNPTMKIAHTSGISWRKIKKTMINQFPISRGRTVGNMAEYGQN